MFPAFRTPYVPRSGTEPSTPRRPSSWSLTVDDDVYRGIAAWTSGAAWFDAVMDDLSTPEGDAARRAARISVSSYLAVAKADRDAADYATEPVDVERPMRATARVVSAPPSVPAPSWRPVASPSRSRRADT